MSKSLWRLTVRGEFASAHALRHYQGKCESLHGHNYSVEMVVEGETLTPDTELVVDFTVLKKELRAELEQNANNGSEIGKKEDEEIGHIVNDAITYLNQRGAFWAQQGSSYASEDAAQRRTSTMKSRTATAKSGTKKVTAAKGGRAHYEMSKIEQYEAKYGSGTPNKKRTPLKEEQREAPQVQE